MSRVVISIVVSWIVASPIGILSGLCFSLLINLLFFYIRRWGGCIEKLGGATFTLLMLLTTLSPLFFLWEILPLGVRPAIAHDLLIFGIQIIGIGGIATYFLRSSRFIPPKPGEPLF